MNDMGRGNMGDRYPRVLGVPQIHEHPILLTDMQFESILSLAYSYDMSAHQHTNPRRAEWGSVACDVIHDVFEILGIKIEKERFREL
jgi:hypothetical protein